MAGTIVGIDLVEAMTTARLLGATDDAALVEYLTAIETAAVIKSLERAKPGGHS
jgi:hypothetical protein